MVANVDNEILELIGNKLDEPIQANDKFSSDLGLDELDAIELIMEAEEKFNIKIPENLIDKIETPRELSLLIKYLSNPERGKPLFLYKKFRRSPPLAPVGNCANNSVNSLVYFVGAIVLIGIFTGTTFDLLKSFSVPIIVAIISIAVVTIFLGFYQKRNQGSEEVLESKKSKRTFMKKVQINISGGQVGNLNLGKVSGDLNANLESIAQNGGDEVAMNLKELAEKILKSDSLSDGEKKSTIEEVNELTNQLSKPNEERKPVLIKSLTKSIDGILSTTKMIAPIWSKTVGLINDLIQ